MADARTPTRWETIYSNFKRFWYRYVVVSLLLSLVAGIWLEWRQEQASAVGRLEAAYDAVVTQQAIWLDLSSEVVSASARAGADYPDRSTLEPLDAAIRDTLDRMAVFYAPTNRISQSAVEYRNALADVAGAINQYQPDEVGMGRLLNTLQIAANVGGELRDDVIDYQTEAWRSFVSVIF